MPSDSHLHDALNTSRSNQGCNHSNNDSVIQTQFISFKQRLLQFGFGHKKNLKKQKDSQIRAADNLQSINYGLFIKLKINE